MEAEPPSHHYGWPRRVFCAKADTLLATKARIAGLHARISHLREAETVSIKDLFELAEGVREIHFLTKELIRYKEMDRARQVVHLNKIIRKRIRALAEKHNIIPETILAHEHDD